MLRAVVTWLLPLGLAAAGALVGWGADRYVLSALILHAEPILLVVAAWAVLGALWARERELAYALAIGVVAAVVSVRLPFGVSPSRGLPPEWSTAVHRCAAALSPPADDVRILQWTLDGTEAASQVRAVVGGAAPGVVVLYGIADEELVGAVLDEVGGESRFFPPEGGSPGLAIVAAGGFHPCGETLEWTDGMDSPYGYTLAFVGVPDSTVFPLLVTRFPGPLDTSGWAERMNASTQRVYELVAGLQGASTVVVADAPAPRTYRALDRRMASAGVSTVAVPTSWPARVGGVPMLTLHPYDRVWVGPSWASATSARAAAPAGGRAPVLTVLSGGGVADGE